MLLIYNEMFGTFFQKSPRRFLPRYIEVCDLTPAQNSVNQGSHCNTLLILAQSRISPYHSHTHSGYSRRPWLIFCHPVVHRLLSYGNENDNGKHLRSQTVLACLYFIGRLYMYRRVKYFTHPISKALQ